METIFCISQHCYNASKHVYQMGSLHHTLPYIFHCPIFCPMFCDCPIFYLLLMLPIEKNNSGKSGYNFTTVNSLFAITVRLRLNEA